MDTNFRDSCLLGQLTYKLLSKIRDVETNVGNSIFCTAERIVLAKLRSVVPKNRCETYSSVLDTKILCGSVDR